MAHGLDIHHFFQRSPRRWLRQYFNTRGVFTQVDWGSLKARNVRPLIDAWLELDDDVRGKLTEDFTNIKLLATPAGKSQIIDEARHYGKDEEVAGRLADFRDFYEGAFWVMLEAPILWDGAIFYAVADGKPGKYWRKRVNLPRREQPVSEEIGTALAAEISDLFRRKEGRGGNCVVHCYRRITSGHVLDYYFAYPQDHRHTALEFQHGKITKRPHAPVFEVVFIHDNDEQTLRVWHEGKSDRFVDLQLAFARAVLGRDIPRDSPRDDRAYDLDAFADPQFTFAPKPELGIAHVEMRRIGVRVLGPETCLISIEVSGKSSARVVHSRLEAATMGIAPSMLRVSRVGLRVHFERGAEDKRSKTRTFDIVWPNSSSLQDDSYGVLIQRMLTDHGIEPKRRDM